jgi:ABC-type glycerol-3-phosphate transport system substrate-binding protein
MVFMKRMLAFLLVSVMVFSLAACGGGDTATESTPSTTTQTTQSGETAPSTTTDETDTSRDTVFAPATYTVYMGDSLNKTNTQWYDTEIGKLIEEITGIRLETEFIVGSDEQERATLIIATGDYRDIIIPHNVGRTFVDAGAFIPINDLYEQHCPNTQRIYGTVIERFKDVDTGILWGLPTATYSSPPLDQPFAAFFMKHDAVAMNDYRTIVDPDEYFNVIREYVAANPTTNGQTTIGFSGPSETWRYVFSLLMAERLYGIPNTGRRFFDPRDNFRVVDRNMQEFRYNYLWQLNQLNQEGLLDPEMFSQTHDEYVAKVASGRVVGFGDEWWQVMDAFALIKQEQRIDDVYIPFALMYEDKRIPGMNCPYAGIQGIAIGTSMHISTQASDPVGILQYVDFLASDEMLELLYWGIEGTHFQRDGNGRRYLTSAQYDERSLDVEFENKTGIGHITGGLVPRPLRPYEELPDGSGVWDWRLDKARVQYIYDDMEKEILSRLGWQAFTDSAGLQWESPFGYGWEIEIPSDDDRLNDIMDAYESELGGENCPMWTQGMVLARSREEFDALWDDLQVRLIGIGIEEVNEYFTMRARMRVEEFNRGR